MNTKDTNMELEEEFKARVYQHKAFIISFALLKHRDEMRDHFLLKRYNDLDSEKALNIILQNNVGNKDDYENWSEEFLIAYAISSDLLVNHEEEFESLYIMFWEMVRYELEDSHLYN